MFNFEAIIKEFKTKNVYTFFVYQRAAFLIHYCKSGEYIKYPRKINSITKSILATLIGIALDRGYIEHIHVPIKKYFPRLPSAKESLTLYHLLTMSTGEEWDEFGNGVRFPSNFVRSKHWVNYVLKRPIVEAPGTAMNYNTGSSHLLSAILQQVTGVSASQFAKQVLFEPLSITEYEWEQDPQGITVGGFGMKMKPLDLLKIGLLYLHNGVWQGNQIISHDWIQQSTRPMFTTYKHIGSYGFHWWVLDKKVFLIPFDVYFAMGYAGQYIIVIPEAELVAVITANMPKQGLVPLHIFIDHLSSNNWRPNVHTK
ncbi:serine hydrolase [Bacillus sp. 165]|uniref:serine hydrolase domain-containing protein n=1 Tax=Bacillus sp. 165 TaxID=1529117 RepID=UPI001ADCF5F0|nr:serine hydrolase [Bacillus sp. 165]MBO9129230.1 serine hydrolase [Bacillus sp. 165]